MSKRSEFDKKLEEYERILHKRNTEPDEVIQARNRLIAYHYNNVSRSRGTAVKRAK
ncbi:hypothetical protein [Rhizobium phage RHEph24]|nr:hypothetical protein [Rhizobium phage RHEph24]